MIRAWPGRFDAVAVDLPDGATVLEALRAASMDGDPECTGVAIHGERARMEATLHEGDRVELLRPLRADPKEARRRRAGERERSRR